MENISEHISWAEATKSQEAVRNGIENIPGPAEIENMRRIANNYFEPLRKYHGKPIGVSSFFRSKELNKAIGGSETSDHCNGCAIDIDADIFNNGISNRKIFEYFKDNYFDQLIWEFGDKENPAWVHISLRKTGNRQQILRAIKVNGQTKYIPFKL